MPHASDLITLHSDNVSTIYYYKNSKSHVKTKNIEIKYHLIRSRKEKVLLEYVSTEQMIANPLTKPFTVDPHR